MASRLISCTMAVLAAMLLCAAPCRAQEADAPAREPLSPVASRPAEMPAMPPHLEAPTTTTSPAYVVTKVPVVFLRPKADVNQPPEAPATRPADGSWVDHKTLVIVGILLVLWVSLRVLVYMTTRKRRRRRLRRAERDEPGSLK